MIKRKTIWLEEDKSTQKLAHLQPPYADDFCDYKEYIIENVPFTKILKHFKLRSEECSTGKYTHRMICPFRFHKNGKERTGSFRFNNKKNTFVCFGCTENGNILHFLFQLIGGGDESNLRLMAMIGGLIKDGSLYIPGDYIAPEPAQQKETNHYILFNIGIYLRKYLLELKEMNIYLNECEWVDQTLIRVDKYFEEIDEENIIDAQKIYNNIINSVSKRKDKRI